MSDLKQGGINQSQERIIQAHDVHGIPEITAEEFHRIKEVAFKKHFVLVDVRRPEEFNNELGHIHGAQLITLGPELQTFLEQGDRNKEIVFVCRSGARSGQATLYAQELGYVSVANLSGGMIRWNELGFVAEHK